MVKNLKKLRTEKGITQQALAAAVGTSQQSINKYENHGVEPDIATLIRLADFFDTSTDYLIDRTDENGSRTSRSETDLLLCNYLSLDSRERLCVKAVTEALANLKKQ